MKQRPRRVVDLLNPAVLLLPAANVIYAWPTGCSAKDMGGLYRIYLWDMRTRARFGMRIV